MLSILGLIIASAAIGWFLMYVHRAKLSGWRAILVFSLTAMGLVLLGFSGANFLLCLASSGEGRAWFSIFGCLSLLAAVVLLFPASIMLVIWRGRVRWGCLAGAAFGCPMLIAAVLSAISDVPQLNWW